MEPTTNAAIVAKREELAAKTKQMGEIIAEAKDADGKLSWKKVKSITGGADAVQAEFERRGKELSELKGEYDTLLIVQRAKDLDDYLNAPGEMPFMPGAPGKSMKSIGEQFAESEAYKARKMPGTVSSEFDMHPKEVLGGFGLKTTMTTAAGWAPQSIRTDVVIPNAQRPIQVLDLIPAGTTTQAAVVFMEETTFTNNAAETAENAAYPESALQFTERTSTVRKIPTFIPATDEQFEDIPQIAGYLDRRLTFMLRQRIDGQVLTGDGIAPNLTGILNAANLQTQAKAADPAFDALFKAYIKVGYTGFAYPSGYVMNPTDWQGVRLTRTTEGIYILGNPDQLGAMQLWGLPVALANALTQGTAIVGDFVNFSELAYRHGINLQVGYINDDFKLGKKSVRAEVRVAFVIYRGAAFCKVTGL